MASNQGATAPSSTPRKALSDFIQFDDETILWSASLMLLKHLQQPQHMAALQGKRVLELGSGLGHLGLGLSRLGAHVTCTERPQELGALQASLAAQQQQNSRNVLETALALLGHTLAPVGPSGPALEGGTGNQGCGSEAVQPGPTESTEGGAANQAHNADAKEGTGSQECGNEAVQAGSQGVGSIQAVALEWGREGFERSPLSTQQLPPFDFIICSELYYIERLFPELLWTFRKFSGPETVVWSIFIDRPFSFMFFSLLHVSHMHHMFSTFQVSKHDEDCWDVDAVTDFDDLGLDSELQVHMHRITLRKEAAAVL